MCFKRDDEKKLKNLYIKLVIHVKAHPNKMTLNVSDFPRENFSQAYHIL